MPTAAVAKRLSRTRAGSPLVELLVVIAIITILASMLLPAIGRAKQKAQGIVCLYNYHQLTFAWTMYGHENDDRVPAASPDSATTTGVIAWMDGYLDFSPTNVSNWDIARDIQLGSPLWNCGA